MLVITTDRAKEIADGDRSMVPVPHCIAVGRRVALREPDGKIICNAVVRRCVVTEHYKGLTHMAMLKDVRVVGNA